MGLIPNTTAIGRDVLTAAGEALNQDLRTLEAAAGRTDTRLRKTRRALEAQFDAQIQEVIDSIPGEYVPPANTTFYERATVNHVAQINDEGSDTESFHFHFKDIDDYEEAYLTVNASSYDAGDPDITYTLRYSADGVTWTATAIEVTLTPSVLGAASDWTPLPPGMTALGDCWVQVQQSATSPTVLISGVSVVYRRSITVGGAV